MTAFHPFMQKLYGCRNRQGYSIETIERVLKKMGELSACHRILVCGTNGKGSVVHKMASAMQQKGKRVGTFTSPHLFSPLERIQINGKNISQKAFMQCYRECKRLLESPPSFFDAFFLVAYRYFQEHELDCIIFEAGIGARLDTSIYLPITMSVITTIGLDHCDLLGETLEEIAFEKSFAIREKAPVILGPKAIQKVLFERAFKMRAPLYLVPHQKGTYDDENNAIASQVLSLCGIHAHIHQTRPPFRLYREFKEGVEVVFDTAHNQEGFRALTSALGEGYCYLIGLSSFRNMEPIQAILESIRCQYYFVSDRSRSLITPSFDCFSSVKEGVEQSFKIAKQQKKKLCIAGSFYLMEKAFQSLQLL